MAIHERNIFFELNGFYPLHISYEDFIPEKKFANIIMSQVLEHVNDPNNWILKSSTILQKNGIVIIALPNFGSIFKKIMKSKEPFIIPPYHLNYFTHKSLKTLLNNNDFEVIYSNTVTRIPLNKKFSHFPKIVIPILSLFGNLVLRFIDLLGYGSIINIYAKKK
ncbi:MAG: methyltransferase domain-containing protein [Saprospiraceae bacterium]|nr:methyltransferase domain-containing protein [Saprospiraceae bacterium]